MNFEQMVETLGCRMSEEYEHSATEAIPLAILEMRSALGLTQDQFAELFNRSGGELKVSRQDISKYERGVVRCPATKYVQMLRIYDLLCKA